MFIINEAIVLQNLAINLSNSLQFSVLINMSSKQEKPSDKPAEKLTPKKMSFSLNNPNDPKPSEATPKNNAALDDDDEFEEFPVDVGHIDAADEDEKDSIWEDNWEDETVGEDFSTELRAELEKMGHKTMI